MLTIARDINGTDLYLTQNVEDEPVLDSGTAIAPQATTVIWRVSESGENVTVEPLEVQKVQSSTASGVSPSRATIPTHHFEELRIQLLFDVDDLDSTEDIEFDVDETPDLPQKQVFSTKT